MQKENIRKVKSVLRMQRHDPTPLLNYNRRRGYNSQVEMQRWVGSSIAESIKGPEVDKVQVKLSKRFYKMGNPNRSAYKFPSTMNSFFY